ncbi:hypothetical protein [Burkholderia sp. 22313]|uniref:hypothetical protein n=1 Tax=Burkholderia sp. 22313 TaxID=3453908 RepID=UPI003F85234C
MRRYRAAVGMVTRVARRTALMTPSPLVYVEGALARPRVAPLDGVPPFGREWTFHGSSGARPGKRGLATLTTSCIDVDSPHRACRWQPLPAAQPASACAPTIAAIADGAAERRAERTPGRTRDRRAMHATCWSIGALGIIGGLIAVHEPIPGLAPVLAVVTAGDVPAHLTQSAGIVRVAAVEPATPVIAPAQHIAARPAATPSGSSLPVRDTTPEPAPRLAGAIPDVHRVATASPASPDRPNGKRTTRAPVRAPSAARLAASPPVTRHASRAPSRDRHDRLARPAHPDARHDPLDDPLALIAMANALQADRPARSTNAAAAGFDWTAQLSHRRLTDAPDTFTR